MKNTDSQFNQSTQVRSNTQPRAIASYIPIALFAALVTALAFIG